MVSRALAAPLALLLASPAGAPAPKARHSVLWGVGGDAYEAGGRLPDFSWAGYRGGDALPNAAVTASVRDFGAAGNGTSDDTAAFQRALDHAPAGVLLVPRGRYRLTRQLSITRSGLTLRGEGPGAKGSVLQFTASIADLQGMTALPEKNKLSWSGGLLQVLPKGTERRLTAIDRPARRGDTRLRVADAGAVRPGDVLFLRIQEDGQRSLEQHLLGAEGAKQPAPLQSTCASRVLDWTFQVAGAEGNDITLTQPLRTDVRLSWAPAVWRMPVVSEVGIEHLAIEFPSTSYPGHHRERGYNAIDFGHNVVNTWVRDVEVRNCDSGIFVGRRAKWLTLTELRFVSSRSPDAKGNQGHHGVALSGCSDVLVSNVTFDAELIHELTLTHRASGNVLSGPASGRRLDLDLHRDAPFENLLQDLTGDLHLQDGGSVCYGPPAGARNTYWALDRLSVPGWIGESALVVGDIRSTDDKATASAWIERVADLKPRDLRGAQRLRRQAQAAKPRR